jgi:DNA-directed RNA polymerase subunit H (RpoH/RPB5)
MQILEHMGLDRIVRVFHGSLKMMALRGYDITPFQSVYDEIEDILRHEENGIYIPFRRSLDELTSFIQLNNNVLYGFRENIINSSGVENFSYLVTNYTTGYRTVVYFYSTDKNLGSDDFSSICNTMKKVSLALTGNELFTAYNSRISGILILKNKLGPNPNKKTEAIDNLEHILDKIILSEPFDNTMQSQHVALTSTEQKKFFAETAFTPPLMPSMIVDNDSYLKYQGFESGSTIEIRRQEYGGQILDKSLYYRQMC